MSVRTLPLVFINLGGEMLYILDQRLRAHNTSEDNSEKGVWSENDRKRVISDIVGTLFSQSFMDELLKPQQLYSHRTMKTVLTRLAHASIMRLSPASMDRLYELMIMAFKHQVFVCPRPKDLLLVSYNHMDSMRQLVRDTPAVENRVEETHRRILEVYSAFSEGELQLLRQTLLIFLQDLHVRVSLFLKMKIQNPNGRFALPASGPVPHRVDVPGTIRMFDCKGREVRRRPFPAGGSYSCSVRPGSFELHGPRRTRLGLNVYSMEHPEETQTSRAPPAEDNTPNLLAKEELNLLARLMGSMDAQMSPAKDASFRFNLFNTVEEEEEEEEAGPSCDWKRPAFGVINIQAVQDEETASELARIAGQFAENEENHNDNKGDDLLAMMDNL
ncbi:protein OSCP1a [Salarias fasciatus]|uniref:protein OSCP1a n=1 Tax=Salarias fasciatus TaxID=181472 RepID=UPI001176EE2E|nr:protein OSCP1-like [Salarias fasciatus]